MDNSINIIPLDEYQRRYRYLKEKVKRLLQYAEIANAEGKVPVLLVVGLPGAGKTTILLKLALRFLNKSIVSFSRRKLRDWWYHNIDTWFKVQQVDKVSENYKIIKVGNKWIHIYRFRSKHEFPECPLHNKEYDTFLDYILDCLLHQATQQCHLQCPYRQQFKIVANLLKGRKSVIIFATHVGGMVLDMVFDGAFHLMIDEYDEYVLSIESLAIPDSKILELKKLNDDIVKKFIEKVENEWFFNERIEMWYPPLIPIHAKAAIIATATPIDYVVENYTTVELVDTYHIEPRYQNPDTVIVLKQIFWCIELWRKNHPIYRYIEDLVKLARMKKLNVGIIAPRKNIAQQIYEKLKHLGNVYCEKIPKSSDPWVLIIVPGDKLYRGISIEAQVVIAFYQRWDIEERLAYLHPLAWTMFKPYRRAIEDPFLGDIVYKKGKVPDFVIRQYVRDLNDAMNVQALFRFIRRHDKHHTVIILDQRMYNALKRFFKRTYLNHVTVKECVDPLEVLLNASQDINQYF